jgi:hypothetical protein
MPDTTFRKTLIILIVLIALGLFAITEFQSQSRTVMYDCSMAEWHPDIPVQIKEECRKIRSIKVI